MAWELADETPAQAYWRLRAQSETVAFSATYETSEGTAVVYALPPDRRAIDWAPDEFDHEISTCVNVKGRGLVVTSSCGHRGVGNSVKQAMAVAGVGKVHAAAALQHRRPMGRVQCHRKTEQRPAPCEAG